LRDRLNPSLDKPAQIRIFYKTDMATTSIRLVVIGLGPIGIAVAKAATLAAGVSVVGLVDVDPNKLGKTLKQLEPTVTIDGPKVVASIDQVNEADVAVVCTTSFFDKAAPLIRACIAKKWHVTSSCEEMAFPAYRHADLAKQMDLEAQKAGVALLGTGVNPGYVMDLLALQISSMVMQVTKVKCIRRVDALTRRLPLQQKVGSTMTVEHFNDLKSKGAIGHKGLAESIAMIAAGLGRAVSPGSVKETLEPLVATTPIQSGMGLIEVGKVRGMHNQGFWSGDGLEIELDLIMACAEPNPRDEIELSGPVPLKVLVPGSTPGDSATVAALVNTARLLPRVQPGLRTMLDIPPASAR
jgi:2,4-diaminopentanoate dehydrogenase